MAVFKETKITYYYGDFTNLKQTWRANDVACGTSRIYYVTDGEIEIEYDGAKTVVRAGEMSLIPAGKTLSYRLTPLNHATKYWFHFDMTVNGDREFSAVTLPVKITVADSKYVTALFKSVLTQSSVDSPASDAATAGSVAILVSYYLNLGNAVSTQKSADAIDKAVDVIRETLNENFTLNELAAAVALSPNYFARKFRERVGIPPLKYVNMLKLERAKSLLENTDLPVSEIMTSVGFLDAAYFCKIFKSDTGHSPRAWRSIYGKKN